MWVHIAPSLRDVVTEPLPCEVGLSGYETYPSHCIHAKSATKELAHLKTFESGAVDNMLTKAVGTIVVYHENRESANDSSLLGMLSHCLSSHTLCGRVGQSSRQRQQSRLDLAYRYEVSRFHFDIH